MNLNLGMDILIQQTDSLLVLVLRLVPGLVAYQSGPLRPISSCTVNSAAASTASLKILKRN